MITRSWKKKIIKKKKKRETEREEHERVSLKGSYTEKLHRCTRGKLSLYLVTQLCNVTRGLSRFTNKNMGYEIMHSYRIKEFRNLHIAYRARSPILRNDRYRNIVYKSRLFFLFFFSVSSSPNDPSWIVLKDGRLKLNGKESWRIPSKRRVTNFQWFSLLKSSRDDGGSKSYPGMASYKTQLRALTKFRRT